MKPLVSVEELRKLMPQLSLSKAGEYAPLLSLAMLEREIVNKKRRCSFLSQLAVESQQLTRWVENLNYSAHRLTKVWPKRFPTIAAAAPYAMNPEALANKVYGGRMGNKNPSDGWKFRGRFPMQATGLDMYRKLARALDIPELVTDPDSCLKDPLIGFRASAWIFAVEKDCNKLADKLRLDGGAHDRAVLTQMCERINGGHHGLADRINYFREAKQILHNDQDPSSPQTPVAPPAVRPAETVDEQESVDSQAENSAEISVDPASADSGTDLLGAAVNSSTLKQTAPKLWPRLTALGAYLLTLYQANQMIGNIIVLAVLVLIGVVVYWKWNAIKAQLIKLLK